MAGKWPPGSNFTKIAGLFSYKFNVFAQRLIEFFPKIKLCHFCNSWNPNFCQNFRKSNEQIEYLQTWKFSPTDLRFFYWPMGNFHRLRPVSGSYIHPCTLSLYFSPLPSSRQAHLGKLRQEKSRKDGRTDGRDFQFIERCRESKN